MLKKILAVVVMLYTALAMAAVDVNKASEAELDNVKGIGPATSKLILTERKKGPFKNWEDFISRVKGVGEGRAAKLSDDGLTVNGSAFKGAVATGKDDKQDSKKDAKAAASDSKPAATKTSASDAKSATTKTSAADAKPAGAAASAVAAAPARSAASAAKK